MKTTLFQSFLLHVVVAPLTVCGFVAVAQAATASPAAGTAVSASASAGIAACAGKQIGAAVSIKDGKGETVSAVCIMSALPSTVLLEMANGSSRNEAPSAKH